MAAPPYLKDPRHVHSGVTTPDEYRVKQVEVMANLRTAGLSVPSEPFDAGVAQAVVSGGKWIVLCVCGNGASAWPAYRIARCCECGAVYNVTMPDDAAEIERILCARPTLGTRHWAPPSTITDLAAENALNIDRSGT